MDENETDFLGILATVSLIFPSSAWTMNAGMGPELAAFENSTIAVRLQGSIEYLSGQSDEYVYDAATGDKISELNWDLKNIVMLGGEISVGWGDKLQLNLGGWTAVSEDSGSMVDRDWLPEISSDWAYYSKGSNKLDHGHMIDVNLAYKFDVTENIYISPMFGFRFDDWKWRDNGGEYIYSINGWRDTTGSFPDGPGIIYEQWLYVPYLGIAVGGTYESFFINTYFKGSPWAWSKDKDQHLLRDLVFDEKVNKQQFIGAGIECGYNWTDSLSIMLDLDYQEFKIGKGSTHIIETTTGETWDFPGDAAGIAHHSTAVSLSVGYTF